MRKLLLAAVTLLLYNYLPAQSLHWGNAFTPPWINGSINGNAFNLGGSSINSVISIGISGGSFGPANGNNGPLSPTVTDAVYAGPGSLNLIELAPNFSNNQQNASMTISFSAPVTQASFYIVDIDKKNPNNAKYLDRVTVTGSNGSNTYQPVITKYDGSSDPAFLVINGNTAYVNPANGQGDDALSDNSDQRGTVVVNFGGTTINSITILYDNAPGANSNPGSQSIGISNILFAPVTLPVALRDFNAHRSSRDVVLNWKTQQETNARDYNIERNAAGSWETIGRVNAVGNTSDVSLYSFTDHLAPAAVLFYRLKQTDIDNHFKYSSVIRIQNMDIKTSLLSYPNPFTKQVNISIPSAVNQQVAVSIVDAVGKTVRSETKSLFAGNNNFTLTGLETLVRGLYYASVKDVSGNLLGQTSLVKD